MILSLKLAFLLLATCFLVLSASKDIKKSSKPRVLSRRKRYVTFPEGSSFSCAGCMTVGIIGQPQSVPGTFTLGVNWGIAYELPNSTETAQYYRGKSRLVKPMEQRRNRRALYDKLETIINKMGYDGRQCILKTLCETRQRLVPQGGNMIEEIFRILFTLPTTKALSVEPIVHVIYDSAHRLGTVLEHCNAFRCPFSLVDVAQGYYNAPAPNLDPRLDAYSMFGSGF